VTKSGGERDTKNSKSKEHDAPAAAAEYAAGLCTS